MQRRFTDNVLRNGEPLHIVADVNRVVINEPESMLLAKTRRPLCPILNIPKHNQMLLRGGME